MIIHSDYLMQTYAYIRTQHHRRGGRKLLPVCNIWQQLTGSLSAAASFCTTDARINLDNLMHLLFTINDIVSLLIPVTIEYSI